MKNKKLQYTLGSIFTGLMTLITIVSPAFTILSCIFFGAFFILSLYLSISEIKK